MNNPWHQLPGNAPRILPSDQSVIDAFNARYAHKPQFTVQHQLFPEPFIGDPNARLYVLGLNPGYSPPDDDNWHRDPTFQTQLLTNLTHGNSAFPFYFFDRKLKATPGAKWWEGKCKWLISAVSRQALTHNMFCVELFPYHSDKYMPVPKSISPNQLVPSSGYSVHLVRTAMNDGKPIIAMRAFKAWCHLIPELGTYHNLFRLNSAQNVALSPGNLKAFDQIVRELTRTS